MNLDGRQNLDFWVTWIHVRPSSRQDHLFFSDWVGVGDPTATTSRPGFLVVSALVKSLIVTSDKKRKVELLFAHLSGENSISQDTK